MAGFTLLLLLFVTVAAVLAHVRLTQLERAYGPALAQLTRKLFVRRVVFPDGTSDDLLSAVSRVCWQANVAIRDTLGKGESDPSIMQQVHEALVNAVMQNDARLHLKENGRTDFQLSDEEYVEYLRTFFDAWLYEYGSLDEDVLRATDDPTLRDKVDQAVGAIVSREVDYWKSWCGGSDERPEWRQMLVPWLVDKDYCEKVIEWWAKYEISTNSQMTTADELETRLCKYTFNLVRRWSDSVLINKHGALWSYYMGVSSSSGVTRRARRKVNRLVRREVRKHTA